MASGAPTEIDYNTDLFVFYWRENFRAGSRLRPLTSRIRHVTTDVMEHPNDKKRSQGSGWQAIRDNISLQIQSGALLPGAQLPTEPELCRMFGATRYALRRAVEALAVDGKLRVEQGRGTFVETASKLSYRVGRRARFRQNLLSQGVEPDGQIISEEIVPASAVLAEALNLSEGAPLHRLQQRSLADGVPIYLGAIYVSALRFPDWPDYVRQGMSATEAYRAYGITDYFRGSTTVHARRARDDEASLLQQHADQPVLVVRKVDVDNKGIPIGYGESIWASSRMQFVFDSAEESADIPSGNGEKYHALEEENARLRRAISDLILKNQMLEEQGKAVQS